MPAPAADAVTPAQARCTALRERLAAIDDQMRSGYSAREAARLWQKMAGRPRTTARAALLNPLRPRPPACRATPRVELALNCARPRRPKDATCSSSARHRSLALVLTALLSLAACQRAAEPPAAVEATPPPASEPEPAPTVTRPHRRAADEALPEGVLHAYVWECDGDLTLDVRNLFREDAVTIDLARG